MISKLFDKTLLGSIALQNRFVRSATWEGMAQEDGACTPALVDLIGELAKGEVALIDIEPCLRQPGRAGWSTAACGVRRPVHQRVEPDGQGCP